MPDSVCVLAPVLRRPERVAPLAESFAAAAPAAPARARLMPICSVSDQDEIQAWLALSVAPAIANWPPGKADWARKINFGFRRAAKLGFDWMLLGADDVAFHPGWFEAALAVHGETGACVVGTNDLGNSTVMRGLHSTHPLVHRDYLECGTADEAGKVVTEAYHHNWVDTELVETAKARGAWAFARDSHVEHLHPFWRKAEQDEVYELGRQHYKADQELFYERRQLWEAVHA